MKNLILVITCLVVVIGQGLAQTSNKIIIKVENISSGTGTIRAAVFNSEKDFLIKPFLSETKVAEEGSLNFEFDQVPNGDYTVSIYHDENENGELDKNFMGIPNEPYGVSKEGKSMFGPPSYKDALFTINNANVSLAITLD